MNFLPALTSNTPTGRVIPGQVIQRATWQSLKELYDQNIFAPMGMKGTQFSKSKEPKLRKNPSVNSLVAKLHIVWDLDRGE